MTRAAPAPESLGDGPRVTHPFFRSRAGLIGSVFLAIAILACIATLPWTLGRIGVAAAQAGAPAGTPRYNAGTPHARHLPPAWVRPDEDATRRLNRLVDPDVLEAIAERHQIDPDDAADLAAGPAARDLASHHPTFLFGTDVLGRSLLIRCLAGGGISLGIGIAAAAISVFIGTFYGALAAYAGGKTDAVMMRIVDILYGLPYILLVVLLAVAGEAAVSRLEMRWAESARQSRERHVERGLQDAPPHLRQDLTARLTEQAAARFPVRDLSATQRSRINVIILLVAIGGFSWLTMARVVRGQVLSLKAQPFMEAARAIGVPWRRQFARHLLPNILGPIIVYATLTVPQAILQESFLSFLGIGVKPPLPSWGTLAADGLAELNTYRSHWWLLAFPCVLLGATLLALNFVGEGLREAFDPRRRTV